jgi:hypothetical protein
LAGIWSELSQGTSQINPRLDNLGALLSVKCDQIFAAVSGCATILAGIMNGVASAVAGMGGIIAALDSINANLAAIRAEAITISRNTVPGQMILTGNVYLNEQEMFSSFVRWSQQSGTVVPGY